VFDRLAIRSYVSFRGFFVLMSFALAVSLRWDSFLFFLMLIFFPVES